MIRGTVLPAKRQFQCDQDQTVTTPGMGQVTMASRRSRRRWFASTTLRMQDPNLIPLCQPCLHQHGFWQSRHQCGKKVDIANIRADMHKVGKVVSGLGRALEGGAGEPPTLRSPAGRRHLSHTR